MASPSPLQVLIHGEYSRLRPASWYHRRVPGYDSKHLRHGSQGRRRRRRRAALWWLVGSVFIIAAVVGLIYLLYVGQAR